MRFRILGPLEVFDGRQWRAVERSKARVVLATLLVNRDRVVSVDRLVDAAWSASPPKTVANQLHGYVARLRKQLSDPDGHLLVSRRPGYQVRASPELVDAYQFRALAERGRQLWQAGDATSAVTVLTEALGMWRGRALADVPRTDEIGAFVDVLEDERLIANECLIEAGLACGEHTSLVAQLRALTREHPLREPFWLYYMLALYRSGRQSDALAAYRDVYRHLHDELGVSPGRPLQETHRRILASDPTLAATTVANTFVHSRAPRPRQLPRDTSAFTGRAEQLEALDRLLRQGAETVPIGLLSGMPGVGKTTLAVHWAYRRADAFPDGQLFVDLHGFSSAAPLDAGEALRRFLRALGVQPEEIPPELDERIALYRSLLAGTRTLVVLDNAADPGQVRPLVPGAPGCLVLITSRDVQAGLVALDGATPIPVDLLSQREAVELISGLLGPDVVKDEELAAADLARQCDHLPLALRVAAANLISHPGRSLSDYLAELAGGDRLTGLELESDSRGAVDAAFDLSYRRLPAPAQRLFSLLGLNPGPDFDVPAAAVLAGLDESTTARLLRSLVTAHLVTVDGARYRMHDLLRDFALSRAKSIPDSGQARRRLLDYYAGCTESAATVLFAEQLVADPIRRFEDAERASAWLEVELANILAAARVSDRHACRISHALYRYLDTRGGYVAAEELHTRALEAARRLGDRSAEALAFNHRSAICWHLGQFAQMRADLTQALRIWREIGDADGVGRGLANLGLVETAQGNFVAARPLLEQAVGYAPSGMRRARAHHNLGVLYHQLGLHRESIDICQLALEFWRDAGNDTGAALAIAVIGNNHASLGEEAKAGECLERALELFRGVGNPEREADVLNDIGNLHRRLGAFERAWELHHQASELYRRIGRRHDEPKLLNDMGRTLDAMGKTVAAQELHAQALERAKASESRYEQARAHEGLGETALARQMYEEMGIA